LIAIYQFGSQARTTARPDSDVDLAILARIPINGVERFDIAQELASLLYRDVDLIDLHSASAGMRMQVLADGTCLESLDDHARHLFEMYAYADYTRLNEERRDIVTRITRNGWSMADDVALNKAASIERCLSRIRKEYGGDKRNLTANQTKQNSIILNLQRACETSIDLAMYVISRRRLGIPQDSRDAFTFLQIAGIGTALLRDAILRTIQAAEIAGITALLVHALTEQAKRFYRSRGFMESPIQPMTLYQLLATTQRAWREE
jgi:predicted nucleotidyltransferase/uncharacterized protein YutE (UPF0331/DUF86 family)